MKTLITGGGGFLGKAIVSRLLEEGRDLRILGRSPRPELESLGVEVVTGNLSSPSDCKKAVQGCDIVHHTAALAGIWGKAKHYEKVNLEGTFHLINASRRSGIKAFIHTSSPSVIFDGKDHSFADESLPYPSSYLCHYPRTKAIAERLVLASHLNSGMRTLALRPHLFWGKGDPHLVPRILERARSGRLRQIGVGNNQVHMVHVKNAAHAHLLAEKALLTRDDAGGQSYFITDKEPVNLWDWISCLLQSKGIPWDPRPVSPEFAYRVGQALEIIYSIFRIPFEPPMTRFVAKQLSTNHTYDTSKAQKILGYEPIIDMEQGMRELLET